MKALVTGTAGFIGSHLAKRLLSDGFEVVGIDCFNDYYPVAIKENNLASFRQNKNFNLIKGDILDLELSETLKGVDYVFHEAAQPGVRASWGSSFPLYIRNNIAVIQKLLEVLKSQKIKKMIFASSSSVYGDSRQCPIRENVIPRPISPYGVTKLAAENLCYLYYKNYDIPVVSLRYFTVYGPGQRPDMAFNGFIRSLIRNEEIPIYGNGEQTRDFTYISDVISANIGALDDRCLPGEIFNVGGGANISINGAIKMLEDISGKKAKVKYYEPQKGDILHTAADISKARSTFGYNAKVGIRDGLANEYKWLQNLAQKVKE